MGLTVDDVLDKIGSFGRFQLRLLLIFGFMYLFGNSILVMIPTFLSIEPPWRCKEGSSACNLTGIFKPGDHNYNFRCSIPRDDWEFDTNEITNSVVTEVSPASGADPGFFLGGGALVSCSTSTPINHIVFFFCRVPVVLENRRSSQGGGGAYPLHPPPRSAPAPASRYEDENDNE